MVLNVPGVAKKRYNMRPSGALQKDNMELIRLFLPATTNILNTIQYGRNNNPKQTDCQIDLEKVQPILTLAPHGTLLGRQ